MNILQLSIHMLWAAALATAGFVTTPTPLAISSVALASVVNVALACKLASRGRPEKEDWDD